MRPTEKELLLSRGLDGELDARERAELDALLASDPVLRKLETEWRHYAELLRQEPAPAPAADEAAWADVRRAIRLADTPSDDKRRAVFGWRLGWAAAMLTVALVGFGVVGVWRPNRPGIPVALASPETRAVQVEFVESELPGAQPLVFEDAETGWTVVWVAGLEEGAEGAKGRG